MPRIAKELSALEVSRLKEAGHHAVGGVAGLYLYIIETGARSWVLRTVVGNKRRHIGLGSFPEVPLRIAKERASAAKKDIDNGIDPVEQRQSNARALKAQQAALVTFEQAATSYIEAHGETWKNPKHRAQWTSTLQTYVYPVIGALDVKDIGQSHVLAVLEPIWKTKNETASRLRGRLEAILDWASVRNHRTGENPARWKGYLDKLLPAPSRIQKVEHHRALSAGEMPAFMKALAEMEGIAARALEFTIFCASRSGEVRGATWAEIDLDSAIWTVPADRMKAGREHRVPLSGAALQLLKGLPRFDGTNWVFPGRSGQQPLSDMSLTTVMRRMKVDAVPHGFRSTFRDWVGESTDYPRELAEQALAHVLESKVEAAYRRGDALEKRRAMMEAWALAVRPN